MTRTKVRLIAMAAALAMVLPLSVTGGGAAAVTTRPTRVLIVLFDQMVPRYADQFAMPNFRELRDAGTNFKNAYLGYMASETVMAHNVITSGLLPKHMGWTDEAYRDTQNLLGKGAGEMHITGDLSRDDFGTLIQNEDYPKLADYLHAADPGSKFIVVGEKSYAVDSAVARVDDESSIDIGVKLSGRQAAALCPIFVGRWRKPDGLNVPSYLTDSDAVGAAPCNRYAIASDSGAAFSYGTATTPPASLYPEDGNRFFPGTDASALAGHLGGDTWVADAAIEMIANEPWSGMFVTLGGIDKAGHMWGAQDDAANFTGSCSVGTPEEVGAAQTHVRCAAENADVQLGKLLDAIEARDAADGGETLVVLTADHGATYGERFYGKTVAGESNSNWYYAPVGVWDVGAFVPPETCVGSVCTPSIYNRPSPALSELRATNNIQFSYQSTAIETWLIDRSVAKKKEGAAAMLRSPGVIASYWRDGGVFRLYGQHTMTPAERGWWKVHGLELVNTMAAPNGPDIVGLLHDRTSYGVYGDHGGAQRSVQEVPMVFWSPSLAFENTTGGPFHTTDVMPTILDVMGIALTAPLDGRARSLD